MNTTAQDNEYAMLDLEVVAYDLAAGFEQEPDRALAVMNLFLVDAVYCSSRMAWLEVIGDKQSGEAFGTPDSTTLPEELLHALVTPGMYPAFASGQLTARVLTQLAGHPEWLRRAHEYVMAAIDALDDEQWVDVDEAHEQTIQQTPSNWIHIPHVFHLPARAAAGSLVSPDDFRSEVIIQGHRAIVEVIDHQDVTEWEVRIQSRETALVRDYGVFLVLTAAETDADERTGFVAGGRGRADTVDGSTEVADGFPVEFKKTPDGWYSGSVLFAAQDVLRVTGRRSFAIGLQVVPAESVRTWRPPSENPAHGGMTEDDASRSRKALEIEILELAQALYQESVRSSETKAVLGDTGTVLDRQIVLYGGTVTGLHDSASVPTAWQMEWPELADPLPWLVLRSVDQAVFAAQSKRFCLDQLRGLMESASAKLSRSERRSKWSREELVQAVEAAVEEAGMSSGWRIASAEDWNRFAMQTAVLVVFSRGSDSESAWEQRLRQWLQHQTLERPDDLWTLNLPDVGASSGQELSLKLRAWHENLTAGLAVFLSSVQSPASAERPSQAAE